MSLFSHIGTFGFLFGVDLLFWAWAFFTALAFLDIIIPDPLPFVDEIVLSFISIGLLLALAVRGGVNFLSDGVRIINNPGVLAFFIVITVLFVGNKVYSSSQKNSRKVVVRK